MDPADIVGAVERTVLTGRDSSGAETTTVVVERRYPYPIEELWDAVTNPERLPRWFAPVSGDLREGGTYAIEGNASGAITACVPPERFALVWEFAGTVSWVTVTLTAVDPHTRPPQTGPLHTELRLEHLAAVGDHWRTYGAGATGIGWDLSLFGLGEYLRTGEAIAQADPDPIVFDVIRESGSSWYAAEVASGADADTVAERRDKTIAFYTGG